MEALNAAIEVGTTPVVKLWMNWMTFIFLAAIAFVWTYKDARLALACLFASIVMGLVIWNITENIHLLGMSHLLFWTPLAVYLWRQTVSPKRLSVQGAPTTVYGRAHIVWALLLFVTIAISLIFDVRDLFLVMMGQK